jgi:hypothetical protein
MRTVVSAVACMRLLDGVIFSAPPAARSVKGGIQPTSCLAPPARPELRPSIMAGDTRSGMFRHPPQPRFHSAEFFRSPQQSNAAHHAPPRIFAGA